MKAMQPTARLPEAPEALHSLHGGGNAAAGEQWALGRLTGPGISRWVLSCSSPPPVETTPPPTGSPPGSPQALWAQLSVLQPLTLMRMPLVARPTHLLAVQAHQSRLLGGRPLSASSPHPRSSVPHPGLLARPHGKDRRETERADTSAWGRLPTPRTPTGTDLTPSLHPVPCGPARASQHVHLYNGMKPTLSKD